MSCSVVDENHCFGGRCTFRVKGMWVKPAAAGKIMVPIYQTTDATSQKTIILTLTVMRNQNLMSLHMHIMLTHLTSHIPTPGTQRLQFHTFTSAFITSWCPCCCNEPRNTFTVYSNASQRSLCEQELDWTGYGCICQLDCVIRNNLSKSLKPHITWSQYTNYF
jgi:hypothetical protein